MVCVFALRELARLEDFGATISEKTWIRDDYPQVAMSVDNPGHGLNVRFAMWTITAAIREAMYSDRYHTSQIEAAYLFIRVAVLRFFAPSAGDTMAVANRTNFAVSRRPRAASTATVAFNRGGTELNGTSGNAQLWDDVTYRDKEIPRRDVFSGIMWVMLNLAPFKIDTPVEALRVEKAGWTVKVTTAVFRPAVVLPPGTPPLHYGAHFILDRSPYPLNL